MTFDNFFRTQFYLDYEQLYRRRPSESNVAISALSAPMIFDPRAHSFQFESHHAGT